MYPPLTRMAALLEVLLCSGIPTQVVIITLLHAAGLAPTDAAGRLSIAFVVLLALLDSVLVVGLVLLFLWNHGERARPVLLGFRPPGREVAIGVGLIVPAFIVVAIVLSIVVAGRALAPERSPEPAGGSPDLERPPPAFRRGRHHRRRPA